MELYSEVRYTYIKYLTLHGKDTKDGTSTEIYI